ncbi:IS5 family transposase [Bacillus thuringiensis]|nr:IS5 family transposase [Bacillus thuringiensis]MED2125793.1 IS5 family transposase [Bacillus thuringiensis]MED2149406.1 IS5 family transposase [Bacillus thuringiensis]MED2173990.1 IS5 family transposase [Bacillus thuringiensis]MED2479223.1 IS5 family transposase [Bacillus thuringiensis]MED2576926.1 IS5 family transposase [Bacillus thuringiensis]
MSYPSDISREKFEIIREELETFSKRTSPRKYDLYDVFNALLYVLSTGCQWRALPKDYPKWQNVYRYYAKWSKSNAEGSSLLETLLKKFVGQIREAANRLQSSSFNIVDAQSVKNADTAEQKGYDGGKKVSGIKRHISVDILGFPHAIHVTTANVTDRKGAIEMYEQYPELKETLEAILTDGGYTGEKFQKEIQQLLNAEVQVAKRSELYQFQVIPKRWIVERSFAWLEKYRRLFKNVERKLETSKQMVVLGFLAILIKR